MFFLGFFFIIFYINISEDDSEQVEKGHKKGSECDSSKVVSDKVLDWSPGVVRASDLIILSIAITAEAEPQASNSSLDELSTGNLFKKKN